MRTSTLPAELLDRPALGSYLTDEERRRHFAAAVARRLVVLVGEHIDRAVVHRGRLYDAGLRMGRQVAAGVLAPADAARRLENLAGAVDPEVLEDAGVHVPLVGWRVAIGVCEDGYRDGLLRAREAAS